MLMFCSAQRQIILTSLCQSASLLLDLLYLHHLKLSVMIKHLLHNFMNTVPHAYYVKIAYSI